MSSLGSVEGLDGTAGGGSSPLVDKKTENVVRFYFNDGTNAEYRIKIKDSAKDSIGKIVKDIQEQTRGLSELEFLENVKVDGLDFVPLNIFSMRGNSPNLLRISTEKGFEDQYIAKLRHPENMKEGELDNLSKTVKKLFLNTYNGFNSFKLAYQTSVSKDIKLSEVATISHVIKFKDNSSVVCKIILPIKGKEKAEEILKNQYDNLDDLLKTISAHIKGADIDITSPISHSQIKRMNFLNGTTAEYVIHGNPEEIEKILNIPFADDYEFMAKLMNLNIKCEARTPLENIEKSNIEPKYRVITFKDKTSDLYEILGDNEDLEKIVGKQYENAYEFSFALSRLPGIFFQKKDLKNKKQIEQSISRIIYFKDGTIFEYKIIGNNKYLDGLLNTKFNNYQELTVRIIELKNMGLLDGVEITRKQQIDSWTSLVYDSRRIYFNDGTSAEYGISGDNKELESVLITKFNNFHELEFRLKKLKGINWGQTNFYGKEPEVVKKPENEGASESVKEETFTMEIAHKDYQITCKLSEDLMKLFKDEIIDAYFSKEADLKRSIRNFKTEHELEDRGFKVQIKKIEET